MKTKKVPVFIIFFLILFYFEILFRFYAVESMFHNNWIYLIIYLISISLFLNFICSFGNPKIRKNILYFLIIVLTIWYGIEIIFKRSFQVYFSLVTLSFIDQALSFTSKFVEILNTNWFIIILLLIPGILTILLRNFIDFSSLKKQKIVTYLFLSIISYLCFYGFLIEDKKELYGNYNLYTKTNNNALNKQTFGALPSLLIEIRKIILPPKETIENTKIEIEENQKEETSIIYEKNTLSIPFDEFIEKEEDSTLKSMHEYFKNDEGTTKNKYTGYFKDKNLILIMAESFNEIAVDKDLTPTLYKLTHEGFVFENFYSPVILSTIGGEFQELTGLYPNLSMLSNVWRKGTNFFPFGYANVFNNLGYNTYAYHNHRYNFQNRDLYLKSLGFNNYLGCQNGLEQRINCNTWPESDLELIEKTTEDYLTSEKPFFTYYVSVSGHMSYNFKSNAMAIKNEDLVKDLPYSVDIKAYLASQIELDKALEKLLKDLEKENVLDDTVIALVGDHYPYDISLELINEIAKEKKDKTIEINRSHFILWNNLMEPVKISKVGGNMDVLPTLLNLFDVKYDSRLIMGRDLLSDSYGLVIFDDNSWISDLGVFKRSTNTFVPKDKNFLYNDYVTKMNQIVQTKINLSKLIIEKDYYKKVLGE